jgi:hypothetical protein
MNFYKLSNNAMKSCGFQENSGVVGTVKNNRTGSEEKLRIKRNLHYYTY